jgi:hypothetical protein
MVVAFPLESTAELMGEAFNHPAAEIGIRTSRIGARAPRPFCPVTHSALPASEPLPPKRLAPGNFELACRLNR